jgi:TetR/AcrR family transcriptional repressor of lmrAB and yxaGH operons
VKPIESPKEKLVQATLVLLRTAGLSGASLNRALDASGTPKGSLYHYFPGGKEELVITALERFADQFGAFVESHWLTAQPFEARWPGLLAAMGRGLQRSDYTLGCPVAATALGLEKGDKVIRAAVDRVLARWTDLIAQGLPELPEAERPAFAGSLLAMIEGALLLARARRDLAPLRAAERFGVAAYRGMTR